MDRSESFVFLMFFLGLDIEKKNNQQKMRIFARQRLIKVSGPASAKPSLRTSTGAKKLGHSLR
jgi:hypothetical protein